MVKGEKGDLQYREKERLRGQKKWRAMTEIERKRAREQTRIRVQRYRNIHRVGSGSETNYKSRKTLGKAVKKGCFFIS